MNSNQIFEYITKLTPFQLHTRNITIDIYSNVLTLTVDKAPIINANQNIYYTFAMQLTFVYYMLFLGPKDEYFDQISLSGVFLKYFDTDVVDNILFQTNLYANQRERNFAPLN